MLPTVTGEFRLGADPELRFSASGVAVGSMRCVASSRKKDDSGEWVDDKTCWIDVTTFKQTAEQCAEHLRKGDLVVVTGRLQLEEWEDKEGNKRSKHAIVANEVGKSLRVGGGKKMERTSGSDAPAADDPWAAPPAASDEPPF